MAARQTKKEINFYEAVQQFCLEKGLTKEAVIQIIEEALISAYKKKLLIPPEEADPDITIQFHPEKNEIDVTLNKKAVEGEPNNEMEISLEDARKINPDTNLGDTVAIKEKPDFSRIISNQARQLVFQKLKDMERELLYNEFKAKEGELTHGYFQRWKKDAMAIDLGKIEGIMPRKEQNPGEKYRPNDRMKAVILKVEMKNPKTKETGPFITLSRAAGKFVEKLFEMEIPEIYEGLVHINDIARIPALRTKIVVSSSRSDIDPVGACVGMKGVRIQAIVRELGNERIDIVQHTNDPVEFITNAISPAKPVEVRVDTEGREALIVVPDSEQSIAIGTRGSNVQLAAQLCKFKLDIKSVSQYNEDMTSPEAREKLEKLFKQAPKEEDAGTPLTDIPGLTKRIIGLLHDGGIKDVETLIEMNPEDVEKISGIGKKTAEQILKLLSESVEWE